jgi:uncharacterized protein YjiS (DUF1127 family)
MRNFTILRSAARFLALTGRPVAMMSWRRRIWHEDDALAQLDDCMLQDIGIDRCEIRHMAPHEHATAEGGTS